MACPGTKPGTLAQDFFIGIRVQVRLIAFIEYTGVRKAMDFCHVV